MKRQSKILKIAYPLFIFAAAAFFQSCEINNSFTKDQGLTVGPADPNDTQGVRFDAAKKVISNNCFSCHTHDAWLEYTTEEQFLSDSLLGNAEKPNFVKGNGAESNFYLILLNNGKYGFEKMPLSGSVSDADALVIKEWIDGMTPAAE